MKAQDFKRLRLTIVVFLIFILFLMVVKVVHPNDRFIFGYVDLLVSPLAASTMFGTAFGWISGTVTSRLLRESNDYVFSYKDWMQLGALALILILGIGGEDFVRSFGRRVNKLAFAGAELSLAGSEPKQLGQAGRSPSSSPAANVASYTAFNGSRGLSLAADTAADLVERDENYIKLFLNGKVRSGRFQDFDTQKLILHNAIHPILSCLIATYSDGYGISDLNAQVTSVLTSIQRLRTPHRAEHPEIDAAGEALAETAYAVVSQMYDLAPTRITNAGKAETSGAPSASPNDPSARLAPRDVPADCAALVTTLCPTPSPNDPHVTSSPDGAPKPSRDECLSRISTKRRSDAPPAEIVAKFADALSPGMPMAQQGPGLSGSHLEDLLTGPYMTIEYASLAAQLGRYEPAAHALQMALDKPAITPLPHSGASTSDVPIGGTEDKVISDWLKVRLRASLASVVEEWIANRSATPPTLSQYHVRNFDQTILLYEGNSFVQNLIKDSGHLSPRILETFSSAAQDFGTCGWDDARKSLFSAYIGAILSYLDFSLSDEEFRFDNSGLISARADFVNDLNLHCLDPATRTLLRAEGLLQWARAQTNAVRIAGDLKSSAWLSDRLDKASDAARLAENTLYSDYLNEKDKRKDTTDVLIAVQGSEILHLWGQIHNVEADINSLR